VGWKGTVRSLQAASNQAQRESQRRQREYERQQAQLAKMAELDRAAVESELFDQQIRALETIHGIEVAEVDWGAIAAADEPTAPMNHHAKERSAQQELESFKPKLLESKKRQERRKAALTAEVASAVRQDKVDLIVAQQEHAKAVEGWRLDKQLAEGVTNGNIEAYREAAQQIEGVSGGELFRFVEIEFTELSIPNVLVGIMPIDQVVPSVQKSLLATGKLSEKQMPKGRYFSIYQDYVCGTALLVANTILGMLPVDGIVVTAQSEMLNSSTGHIEETPILSIYAPRDTMSRLNLARVDASDAMANFNHNMSFLKTKGFKAIEPLDAPM
jgi:hypothetical protein